MCDDFLPPSHPEPGKKKEHSRSTGYRNKRFYRVGIRLRGARAYMWMTLMVTVGPRWDPNATLNRK